MVICQDRLNKKMKTLNSPKPDNNEMCTYYLLCRSHVILQEEFRNNPNLLIDIFINVNKEKSRITKQDYSFTFLLT